MPLFTDQLHRTIEINTIPERIISVVPSQTELLFDLGLDQAVVGITKFCVHPETWYTKKPRVGGTKTLNIGKIRQLQPDLIIANKEENDKDQIEELAKDFPVWISDVNKIDDAYEMIKTVGTLTGKEHNAASLIARIKTNFAQLAATLSNMVHSESSAGLDDKIQAAYLIWKDPYMAVGGNTFINDMMNHAGFENVFEFKDRYPEIVVDDLQIEKCQLLLLSTEPYPFKEKHRDRLAEQLPGTKVILTDGEIFSWYGSRLQHAPDYFKNLHHQIAAML